MSNENSEQIIDHYARYSIKLGLKESSISPPLADFVTSSIIDNYQRSKKELGIIYPVNLRPNSYIEALHRAEKRPKNIISFGYFTPSLNADRSKTVTGNIEIDIFTLQSYSQLLAKESEKIFFTPWELIGTIAHELCHAKQAQDNLPLYLSENELDSLFRQSEYDARYYEYEYLRKIKANGVIDYIRKADYLRDVKNELKEIRNNRRKIGLK